VTATLTANSPLTTTNDTNNVNVNVTDAPAGAHLTDLSGRRMAIVRIWDAMFRGARSYVERHGFVGVHNMPEIVGVTGACENVDTLFKVDFFGKPAFLAQSDQLYLELLTPKLGRVYAEIQSFRMEPDADDRHLCQFSLFEIEHLGNLDELIGHISGIVQAAAREVVARCGEELALFGRNPNDLRNLNFGRITYGDAIELLANDFPNLAWGDDLKADHEAAIVEKIGPCFITHYPKDIKFFNMKLNEDDPRVVNSTDLLLPKAGESAGAAEREHEHGTIVERLHESDMYARLLENGARPEDFDWYLDAHKDREIPLHSGAGIGMARVAQFILGQDDIRDAVPFLLNRDNLL
jgi:asparaginyl-tRNA synthetase